MYATSSTLFPPQSLFLSPHLPPRTFLYRLNFLGFPVRSCCCGGGFSGGSFCDRRSYGQRRRKRVIVPKARVSPYEVLGVSPSATPQDIKRAYRRLALKYHPDVNKEANAQEKFLRIKHAYTTLINSESRGSDSPASGYSGQTNQKGNSQVEEDFYGLGDFFKDLEEEFKNWEASASSSSQGTPKSLWEELAEIGEEFVEFLEKELSISDEDNDGPSKKGERFDFSESSSTSTKNSIGVNIDEIEATLAQLKKDLGLQ
ncbi:chaperone protein DnaJ-like isoform X2 [Brassica napus]|uniref:chaperone protein DnaJ-like isoform X2 n=1 Tax=Brassica napus TaxID=3708 RepID=UPI0006AAC438|nr:chaperone protein DnaJ-like isoform X2 [Brassica napus]